MTCWVCSAVKSQFPDGVPAAQADPLLAASWVTVYPQCSAAVVGSVAGFTEPEGSSCWFSGKGAGSS